MNISTLILFIQSGGAGFQQLAKFIKVGMFSQNDVRVAFINIKFIDAQFDVDVNVSVLIHSAVAPLMPSFSKFISPICLAWDMIILRTG